MVLAAVSLSALLAGFVQSVAGFGSGPIMMLVLPYFFNMLASTAYCAAISLGLTTTMLWKFRKYVVWEKCIFITVVYLCFSSLTLMVVDKIDLNVLKLMLGIFFVLLAVYEYFFSKRLTFQPTRKVSVACAAISGICSALFGIGGPLMALYYTTTSESKEEYMGNIHVTFLGSTVLNTIVRSVRGIYTLDMVPITLVGIAAINIGKLFGLRILEKLDSKKMKEIVYALIGINGVLNILQYIF